MYLHRGYGVGIHRYRNGDAMIVIHDDRGMTYGPRAYIGSVNRTKRLKTEDEAYVIGKRPPNYPMPALANTNMVLCLGYLSHEQRMTLAWDGRWLYDDLIDIPMKLI